MADVIVHDSSLQSIADAIRAKTGGTDTYKPAEMAAAIFGISGGVVTASGSNDVTFRDYDGTIVASYSVSEFANLSALPDNPTHDGLTSQGWNWSLADAKSYVAEYGKLEIGQMYITDDGKTRIHVIGHLNDGEEVYCIEAGTSLLLVWYALDNGNGYKAGYVQRSTGKVY